MANNQKGDIVAQAIKITFTPDQDVNKMTRLKIENIEDEIKKIEEKIQGLVSSIDVLKVSAKDYVQKESDPEFKMSIEKTSIRNLDDGTFFFFKVMTKETK